MKTITKKLLKLIIPITTTIIGSYIVPRIIYPEWISIHYSVIDLIQPTLAILLPIGLFSNLFEKYINIYLNKDFIFKISIISLIITSLLLTIGIPIIGIFVLIIFASLLIILKFIPQVSNIRSYSKVLFRFILPLITSFLVGLLLPINDKYLVFGICMGIIFYYSDTITSSLFNKELTLEQEKTISIKNSKKIISITSFIILILFTSSYIYLNNLHLPKNKPENLYIQNFPNNTLGNIEKPSKIYLNEDNQIFSVSKDGEQNVIPINSSINFNQPMYFDKINNRIFYISEGVYYYYDIDNESTISTKINTSIGEIYGASKNHILLQNLNTQYNNTIFTAYDLNNSQQTTYRSINSYTEGTKRILFINDKTYELSFLSRTAKTKETITSISSWTVPDKNLKILFNELPETYEEIIENQLDNIQNFTSFDLENNNSLEPDLSNLVIEIPSNMQRNHNQITKETFRINNIYLLTSEEIGLEIDNQLLVINLETKKTTSITDPTKIFNLLKESILISSSSQNNSAYKYICEEFINFDYSISKDATFIFCLE